LKVAARRPAATVERLHANRGVRADERALVALNAERAFQTGISAAMLRFSYFDVPTGNVPSDRHRRHRQRSPCRRSSAG
jgi:hypothetical protein